jgi:hypothetical protein
MSSSRGAHPEDETLFAPSEVPSLRAAVRDLSWLRTRGYGDNAAESLVGDHYGLHRRQRNAVARSACADDKAAHRRVRRRRPQALSGEWVEIDGFNLLITLEGALGGAYLFVGRDGAYRDVNAVQGTYRPVDDTIQVLEGIRAAAHRHALRGLHWRLDRQVSNVGRLKTLLGRTSPETALGWDVSVHDAVDPILRDSPYPVATSDSDILDAADSWCALEAPVIRRLSSHPNLLDLCPSRGVETRSADRRPGPREG